MICKQFEQAATLFELTINTKKTVTLLVWLHNDDDDVHNDDDDDEYV